MYLQNRCWAIIPAAGVGSRLGAHCPKQFLTLGDKALMAHTLDAVLMLSDSLEKVVVVLADPNCNDWQKLGYHQLPIIHTTTGGATRAHSVWQGLQAIATQADEHDWVLVHDAARPVLRVEMVHRLMAAVTDHEVGGIVGMPVTDTVKSVSLKGNIEDTLVREKIWLAQTPQIFRYGVLCKALSQVLESGEIVTDESSAVERLGLQPKMVLGDPDNIKVTTWQDIEIIKSKLALGVSS